MRDQGVTGVVDESWGQGAVLYLVSELLEGQSLHEESMSREVTTRKVTEYAAQIAQGLAPAHDKN